ncbi:MAG: DUF2007 domain-containing protein [Candidatus Binatia bacterium]
MWETCYTTASEIQAHLVKGYLEQYGVPCLIDGGRFAVKPLGLGEVRLLVHADWSHIARGLIRGRETDGDRRRGRNGVTS